MEPMSRSGVDRVNSEGGERMGYVLDFQEIDHSHVAVVGGKGALLGELSRIEGISVPPGLCVRRAWTVANASSVRRSGRLLRASERDRARHLREAGGPRVVCWCDGGPPGRRLHLLDD
jgi:hypothetical protein